MSNPLIRQNQQSLAFDQITAEQVTQAVDWCTAEANRLRDAVVAAPVADVTARLEQRDVVIDVLEVVICPLYLIKETHPDEALRDAARDGVAKIMMVDNELSLDEGLYQSLREFAESKPNLSPLQDRFLQKTLENYQRNGFQLDAEGRAQLKELDDQLNDLNLVFQKNLAESDDFLMLNEDEMIGMPDDFKEAHRQEDGRYKVDVSFPVYRAFMKLSAHGPSRKALYYLYNNRARDTNLDVLNRVLDLRIKKSSLLGFKTYAGLRHDGLMSKKPERVWSFLQELSEKVSAKGKADYQALCDTMGVDELPIWDKNYATTRYKQEHRRLDDEEVKQYLSFDDVVGGLLELAQTLYGVTFRHNESLPVWHGDVRAYEVVDQDKVIGRFYLDMFPRPNKYSHAACFTIRNGRMTEDGYRHPESALVCNFPKPSAERPSLLPHSEVETFFHEFGHLMHQLLTTSPLSSFAGTSVDQDFVEMPSQIMENWVWEKESLQRFARHYQTGEPMPDELIDRLIAVRHVNSALDTQQQLFYAAVDLTYHDRFQSGEDTTDVVRKLQKMYTPFDMPEGTAFQASFGHLMGYAAGYYGYQWAKVFADDMFSVFKEKGLYSEVAGRRFRETILAQGGCREPMDLIVDFLGREPGMDGYLANLGIDQDAA